VIAIDAKNPNDARPLIETGAPVFLFVNPLEYHGPHLSLENDALVAQGLARDLHARLSEGSDLPFLTASPISAGCDVTVGPGAVETPYREVKRLVLRACRSLVEIGAKKVVLMTFHGGPNHGVALQAGVRFLEEKGVKALAPLHLILREMLTVDPKRFAESYSHIADLNERAAVERELCYDFHAGFFETSMALHYAPESVSQDLAKVPPCPEVKQDRLLRFASRVAGAVGAETLSHELRFAAQGVGWKGLTPFPGYTGRPAHATAASGAFFARHILDRYFEAARDVFAGRAKAPAPIMRWLPVATLGGRLQPK
jgi:creatinine amidohydrolase